MTDKCIVCGGRETAPCYQGVVRCQQCGHVYADARLSAEELAALYQRQYFFGEEYQDYLADKAVAQKNFALRMKALRPYLQPERHRHVFEIGAAYGFFLDTVRDSFATVRGIDITEDGPRYAREQLRLDVAQGDFLAYPSEGQVHDVVCLWDTIEHLQEPQRYIEKISAHTTPGALLAITTGDIASLNARWKKDSWRLLHPPTHLHYFSPRTLAQMLEHYGFSVIYNRYCGFYRSVENMLYNIFVLRRQSPRLYEGMKGLGLTKGALYLNLYDIMYVIAQRR
jgi:2-polyprenyl-3-methyl-5-hydroxy-6-metoxy-1,4-benzoquinol methylase